MKAEAINVESLTGTPEVKLTHRDESLVWAVSSFTRGAFTNFDNFEQINQYWESLPMADQDHIFEIYRNIREIFDNIWDRTDLMVHLSKEVTKLMDSHDFEQVSNWVVFKSNIHIPETFEKEYVDSVDRQGSREQTYIYQEYRKLVVLSLILRTMIPVWGEFISRFRQETGNTFKEYYAFQLLNKSKIIHCEAFEKLKTYIDHNIGSDVDNPATIINGISSEDFPVWMLSLVTIRRLTTGDIRGIDPKANMVTYVYKFITQKGLSGSGSGAGIIKDKTSDEGSSDPESKLSTLDRYKIKHDIAIGEIVELEYSIQDLRGIAFKLSPSMTEELFQRSMETAKQLARLSPRVLDPQMTLLRWTFKPVISPRGLLYLSKETIIGCLGVCQAVLWSRGHKYLALLATSYGDFSDNEMLISGVDSRARIPKEMVEELNTFYPFLKRSGKRNQAKQINFAQQSIDILTDSLAATVWNMSADQSMITEHFGPNHSRRIPVPHDIKIKIAQFVIELARRDWK